MAEAPEVVVMATDVISGCRLVAAGRVGARV
jgi:hypothetical protein